MRACNFHRYRGQDAQVVQQRALLQQRSRCRSGGICYPHPISLWMPCWRTALPPALEAAGATSAELLPLRSRTCHACRISDALHLSTGSITSTCPPKLKQTHFLVEQLPHQPVHASNTMNETRTICVLHRTLSRISTTSGWFSSNERFHGALSLKA